MWRKPQLAIEAAAAFATPETGHWSYLEDPLFIEAQARARLSVERMLALHARRPGDVLVKFPWAFDGTMIERIWAQLLGAEASTLRLRPVSEPLVHDGPALQEMCVPADKIDDWVRQAQDGVHGGWSVQAELAIAGRDGLRVPANVADMRERFLDSLAEV